MWRTALVLLILCLPYAHAAAWCVAVWYPSSEHPGGAASILEHSEVIDIVHPFWYSPRPDGSLVAHPGAEDLEKLDAWREAGLLAIPSIFTGTWMVLEPELRPVHIEAIVSRTIELDYDGIDIDYEGFSAHTREDFSAFIEMLAEELHLRGKLLSVTVHAKTEDRGASEGAGAQDWERLADAADLFNVMTYDYTNRNEPPGPITPLSWMLDVLGYAASVTDLNKVRLGLPLYGYSWQRGRPPARAVTWEAVAQLITSFELEPSRHPDSFELQLELAVRGLPRQTMMVNDALSISKRLERALGAHPHLGGVAIWGLGGEDPVVWEVLRRFRPAPCSLR